MRKIYSAFPVLLLGISLMGQTAPGVKKVNDVVVSPQISIHSEKNSNEFEFYEKAYQGVNSPKSSVTDSEGNTYITGTSSNVDHPQGNMFTVKFDSQGNLVWEKREETVDFAAESGFAITLDGNNDPVVAGISWNGDNMDIRTTKYNKSSGETIWSSDFDGGYEGFDYPQAITIDNQNNIIVGGMSYSETTSEGINYVTIKYNSEGEFLWSVLDENDVEDVWIQPYAVATDENGNVAITGYGSNSDLYQVFYTIKYSAEGDLIWKNKYEYLADGNITNSIASDVGFDSNGNCFVTGTFNDSSGESLIGTIKYSQDGDEEWIKTYKNPNHTTLGYQLEIQNDIVYVAGLHRSWEPTSGSVLLSYSADDGEQNWVEESNNLIITGDAIGTYVHLVLSNSLPVVSIWGQSDVDNVIQVRKYNTDGTLNNEKNYTKEIIGTYSLGGVIGLGVDESNSVYISFSPRYTSLGETYEIAKFEENNDSWAWNEAYSNMGASTIHYTTALAGTNGTTTAAGYYISIDENENVLQNFFVTTYNADGEIVWEKIYTPEEGYVGNAISLNIDEEGNIYPLITPNPFDMETKITLQKISAVGDVIWEKQKELIFPESFTSPFIDSEGNVYVAGVSHESETEYQPFFNVIKYDSEGEELWNQFVSSGNDGDNLYYLASGMLDNEGNLLLAGQAGVGSFFSQTTNSTLLKIKPDGNTDWINTFEIDGWNSGATGLFINEENQIFVSGWKENQTNINLGEMIAMKYSADGEMLWDNSYGESGRRIRAYGIKPTSENGFVITGFSNHVATQVNRVIAVKFDEEGELVWNQSSSDFMYHRDFYVDDLDNVYVLTQEYTSTNPKRIYYSFGPFTIAKLMKISADGTMGEETFIGDELSAVNPGNLIPQENGTLLIGGEMSNELGHFAGIKFFETTHEVLSTNENDAHDLSGNWLGQNYPNPSKETTTIPFRIEQSSLVQIKLYDTQGKLIRIIVNQNYTAGKHSVEVNLAGISKGIYFYQLKTASGFVKTKKIIVN